MADWLKQAALRTAGRRWGFALWALVVLALHLWLAVALDEMRLDWETAAEMPKRLQVAYVRELAQAEPPAPPPRAVPKPKPKPRVPEVPAVPASAPEVIPEPVPEGPPPVVAAAAEPVIEAPPVPIEPAASAVAAVEPFEWPASTRLSYVLTGNYRGEVNGNAQVEWIRQGERYQINLDVAVGPSFAPLISRRMTSDGELTPQGLRPLRYDEDTKILFRDRRRVSVFFQGADVVLANGRHEPAEPGVQDTASQFVQLTWLFLTQREQFEPGRVVDMPLALPRKLYRWRYEVIGDETLQTPMGPLQTWHLKPQREAGGGDLTAEVWIAPRLQYLPVRLRIHQDANTFIDLMLKAPPQQAAPTP
ncbi:MAG: DUF3108 domain-containing protein [Burkholderiaceae bacterium]|nr:DUF3108 domain-containing protein [Burkholderiaceae bacterium]